MIRHGVPNSNRNLSTLSTIVHNCPRFDRCGHFFSRGHSTVTTAINSDIF